MDETLRALVSLSDAAPLCPRCRGRDGSLGTSGAYYVCRTCAVVGGTSAVWYVAPDETDYDRRFAWAEEVAASPWRH